MSMAHFHCSNVAELRCIFSSNDVQVHNSSLTISNEAGIHVPPRPVCPFAKRLSLTDRFSGELIPNKELTCCKVEDDCFSSETSNFTTKYSDVNNYGNQTIVDFDEVWMRRIREVQAKIQNKNFERFIKSERSF